jgi:peptidyl-prolyl cis-trans isomerase B (cyclophilin B)
MEVRSMVTSGITGRRLTWVLLPAIIFLMLAAAAHAAADETGAVPTAVARSTQQEQKVEGEDPGGAGEQGGGEDKEDQAAPRVVIELEEGGEIVLELMPDEAPIAVERFTELVNDGFYNGLRFHRVESWIVQTGKRDTDLEPIEGEMFFQDLKHDRGMVGMARLVDDYDSATTQFYIIKEHKSILNGEYTLFARVVDGMDKVMKIKKGDEIEEIRFIQ